jgi:hypothetical protein
VDKGVDSERRCIDKEVWIVGGDSEGMKRGHRPHEVYMSHLSTSCSSSVPNLGGDNEAKPALRFNAVSVIHFVHNPNNNNISYIKELCAKNPHLGPAYA